MAKMDLSFTSHLENFEQDSKSYENIEAIVDNQLKVLVKSVLKRKNLYSQPPSLIGYAGENWRDSEVLESLLWDCYGHVFGRKLKSLLENLLVKGNVDGLIRLHVRNYIRDQQRITNPIGCAVYDNLVEAIKVLVSAKSVSVEPVGRPSGLSMVRVAVGSCAEPDQIEDLILNQSAWKKAFRTSVGSSVETQRALIELVPLLPVHGIAAFKVGELSNVATRILRGELEDFQRDDILEKKSAEKITHSNRTIELAVSYSTGDEQVDLLAKLKSSRSRIESAFKNRKVRARMEKLVDYIIDTLERGDEINWSDAAEFLGIPRTRVYEDRERLKQILVNNEEN